MWPSPLVTLMLFGAGLIAGWVNTLAGAGGLVAIPALLLSGLSPHVANGTLRLAIIVQCLVGASAFRRAGRLPLGPLAYVLPITVGGGVIGAFVATALAPHVLETLELVVLVVMALGMLVRPAWFVPRAEEAPRSLAWPSAVGLMLVGFYGGLVQAGVGLLFLAVLCGVMRFDLLRGNAIKLAATLSINLVGLTIFALADQVEWRRGAILSAGSLLGAALAVRFALRRGQEAIRWVILVAVLAAVVALVLTR